MNQTFGSPWDDYHKWRKLAYEATYGKGSWDGGVDKGGGVPKGFREYNDPFKTYWNDELSVGVLERNSKFIGVACLVAKEVVDRENFVRKFGLSFEKDVQWKAASSLLDHLSESPLFKAVLITMGKVPFKLEADVPEDLKGRLNWAERNYLHHKQMAENLDHHIETYPHADFHPRLMKEEEDYAGKFLQTCKVLESEIREHMKQYFLIKENLFATALFFYVYTHPYPSFEQAVEEILGRRGAAKIEANLTYFVKCTEVKDPLIVFSPEFFPFWNEVEKHCCLALAEDSAGFEFARKCAEARATYAHGFLVEGQRIADPNVVSPTMLIDWRQHTVMFNETALQWSAWRSTGGDLGFVFTNIWNQTVPFDLCFNFSDYGIYGQRFAYLFRDGEFVPIGTASSSFSSTFTIKPCEILVAVFSLSMPLNIAIGDLTPNKSVVGQGLNVSIDIEIWNRLAEACNVTLYCDSQELTTRSVALIPPVTTVTLQWNTSGIPTGNHTVTAYLQPLANETDISDNNKSCWIMVSLAGDITGAQGYPDGRVDMRDLGYAAKRFGTDPSKPLWDPNADMNEDGKVDMRDIATVAREFGKTT